MLLEETVGMTTWLRSKAPNPPQICYPPEEVMGLWPGLRPTQGDETRQQPLPIDQPLFPCHPDRSEAKWRDPRFVQV